MAAQTRAYRYGNGDMQIHLALSEPPRWQAPGMENVAITHITTGTDAVSRAINEANCGLLPREATIVVGQPAALDPDRVPAGKGLPVDTVTGMPAPGQGRRKRGNRYT